MGPLKRFKFLITACSESLILSIIRKLKCPIFAFSSNVKLLTYRMDNPIFEFQLILCPSNFRNRFANLLGKREKSAVKNLIILF